MFSETEKIMLEFFVEREGEGIVNVIRSLDFIHECILDSMDFIVLACFVEEKFGKKLDLADDKTFRAMRRFDDLIMVATAE